MRDLSFEIFFVSSDLYLLLILEISIMCINETVEVTERACDDLEIQIKTSNQWTFINLHQRETGQNISKSLVSVGILYSNEHHGKGDFSKAVHWFTNQHQR